MDKSIINVLIELVRRARRRALSFYNRPALAPSNDPLIVDWDMLEARAFRYQLYEYYYFNTVYSELVKYAAQHKVDEQLYRYVKALYNPIARFVDFYVSQIFSGNLDTDTAQKDDSAMPIVADDEILTGIIQLWKDSNWQRNKGQFVRQCAMKGDAVIKIVEDRGLGVVRMEVLPPGQLAFAEYDSVGNVTKAVIMQTRREVDPSTGFEESTTSLPNTFEYVEVITPAEFVTYKDGVEFAFVEDANGTPLSRWKNDYGFVPIVTVQHKDIGKLWGATGFHNTLNKVDNVNDLASNLSDQIRKIVYPVFGVTGASAPKVIEGNKGRDSVNVMYFPDGSSITPMVAPLDIVGALSVINNQLQELENDLPELSLTRIREQTQVSGASVNLQFQDAIKRIQDAFGNYADGVVRAQQMALYIGALNSYEGYTQLAGRERDELEHVIKARPVFSDMLTKQQRIASMQASNFPTEYIADELGYSEEESLQIATQVKADETEQLIAGVQASLATEQPAPQGGNNE